MGVSVTENIISFDGMMSVNNDFLFMYNGLTDGIDNASGMEIIMSIEHSLKIKGEKIPIQHFLDYCNCKRIKFEVEDDIKVYIFDWEMWVYFGKSKPPYNVWECNAFGIEFEFQISISFKLGKNPDYWQIQNKFVLEYVFELMKEIKREGLFLYCTDTELCYFRADGSIQYNKENEESIIIIEHKLS